MKQINSLVYGEHFTVENSGQALIIPSGSTGVCTSLTILDNQLFYSFITNYEIAVDVVRVFIVWDEPFVLQGHSRTSLLIDDTAGILCGDK